MTLKIDAGRLTINKGGVTRLNTDDKLLHGTSSGLPIAGTVSIAEVDSSSGSNKDLTNVYDLGAATSGHTQLIGAVKFNLTGANLSGLAYNRWHMLMGGSIMWLIDGEDGFTASIGDNLNVPRVWVDYHFRILSGRVEMVRRLFLGKMEDFTYTVVAHEIDYKLRSGNWT